MGSRAGKWVGRSVQGWGGGYASHINGHTLKSQMLERL